MSRADGFDPLHGDFENAFSESPDFSSYLNQDTPEPTLDESFSQLEVSQNHSGENAGIEDHLVQEEDEKDWIEEIDEDDGTQKTRKRIIFVRVCTFNDTFKAINSKHLFFF